MDAVAVTAETLSSSQAVRRLALTQLLRRSESYLDSQRKISASQKYIQGTRLIKSDNRVGNWWDGLFRIKRKETTSNEYHSQHQRKFPYI